MLGPESRGNAHCQEAQDRQASSPEAQQGPRQRHLRRKQAGAGHVGALRGCRGCLQEAGVSLGPTEPGRGSTATLPQAPRGCWLPGRGNTGPR